jgi:hypothetical protein
MIAAVRPDSWNFPLLLHVVGAMVLVGGLAVLASTLVTARRATAGAAAGDDGPSLTRLAFRVLLFSVLPGYVVMRIGAQWVESKEFGPGDDDDVPWLGIGYITADAGLLLLIVTTIVLGIAARRARDGRTATGLTRAALIISGLLLVAYVVAVWAMTTKPD